MINNKKIFFPQPFFSVRKAIGCIFWILFVLTGCSGKRYPDPLSPEEALKSFRLNEDFNVEIFAAEPFVRDPVDMVFDDEGKAISPGVNPFLKPL